MNAIRWIESWNAHSLMFQNRVCPIQELLSRVKSKGKQICKVVLSWKEEKERQGPSLREKQLPHWIWRLQKHRQQHGKVAKVCKLAFLNEKGFWVSRIIKVTHISKSIDSSTLLIYSRQRLNLILTKTFSKKEKNLSRLTHLEMDWVNSLQLIDSILSTWSIVSSNQA